jgi:hypothetical protein
MLKHTFAGLFVLLLALAGCQTPDKDTTAQTAASETTAAARQPRPKPEFFSIPPDLEKKRVYICMGESDDTFHQKHDCPELVSCKGTFRNLTLTRAIENFDRYNCETCSSDLAEIFDENVVRLETGFGEKR